MIQELFANHRLVIIFLHVISAVIWVGGMIAMRYAAHYSFQNIEEAEVRLRGSLYALKRLFILVAPFIILLLTTALIMAIGLGFEADDDGSKIIDIYAVSINNIIYVKESIWFVMTLNYVAMVFRRNQAQKLLDNGDLLGAKNKAMTIAKYMVPLNIILGIVAIFFGVYLSGFLS